MANSWFYGFACRGVDLITRVITNRHVVGLENVPSSGAVLLVSNHIGLVDPPLIGAMLPRVVHFMAKEELFHNPIVKWVVTNYHAFPVRRGEGDREAYQTTIRLLKKGEVVGIFPEGTRSRTGTLQYAHTGAAAIAARSGVVVLPVGVSGTEQIFRWPRRVLRPKVCLVVGKPFVIEKDEGGTKDEVLARQTERIMYAISSLLPEEYRGVYGEAKPRQPIPR